MPRIARKQSSTGIYHVILRGINKRIIFESREDGNRFIEVLRECKNKSGYDLYGFCLMSNHVHLLLKENEEDLSSIMKRIGVSYVYWYNRKYERSGHLFQGRFKSEAVENEVYLLNVLRYIHQNPTKAKIVDNIDEYRWSSYPLYIENNQDDLINMDFILDSFHKNRELSIKSFVKFHGIDSDGDYLDIDNISKPRIKDSDGMEIIKEICGVDRCSDLRNLDHKARDNYLSRLKKAGLSTRQIERLTGIGRHIVLKA